MRKALLMAGVLLAMTSTVAFAIPGVDLAWQACIGQVGATDVRTSACAVTTGNAGAMYASFNPPAGVLKLEGIEVFIDYQIAGGALPCWWNFSTGQQRELALVPLHPTPADINGDPAVACGGHYFLTNNSSGGGGMIVTNAADGRGQLKGIGALVAGTGQAVAADVQQYGVGFRVTNSQATDPNCPGCLAAGCFVVNLINLTSTQAPTVALSNPNIRNYVVWQGSASSTNCPGATPTRNATWGSVKALYR